MFGKNAAIWWEALPRGLRAGQPRKDLGELGKPGRLHDHLRGSELHRLPGFFVPGMSRKDHDRHVRKPTPDAGEHGQAPQARHDQVQEHPVHRGRLQKTQSFGAVERDGVDVRILVPQRNDHPWVTLLTRRYYRRLLTNGVRIWEYTGAMMHAKTSVVDGRWVRVGSTDFNPLGVAINYELDAVIEDPALGAQAEAMFLEDLERSKEITMKSRVVGR